METPNIQPLEVTISPKEPQILVVKDSKGEQSAISADRFMEMTQRGMSLSDIYSGLRKADATMDRLGLDADRRANFELLYGVHASASNLRDGTYLVSCTAANDTMMDSYKISKENYVSLRAGGLDNGQIYGAIVAGKVPAEKQERDQSVKMDVQEIGHEQAAEARLDSRISSATVQGNTLSMVVDGKKEEVKLSPRELGSYAQGVLPLSNLANEHLKMMDIMASASQNFEMNMGAGEEQALKR